MIAAAFNPMDPRHVAEAHERFALLRREHPVTEPLRGMHLLVRDADVRRVLCDPQSFSSRANNTGSGLVDADLALSQHDPPEHGRLRAAVRSWFAPRAVAAVEAGLRDRARRLIDDLPSRTDLVARLARPLPVLALGGLLGLGPGEWGRFRGWCESFRTLVGREADPQWAAFTTGVDGMLAARRASDGGPGLLGRLADPAAGLDAAEARTLVHFLIVAGVANPRLFLGALLRRMADSPELWTRVADRPDGPAAAVEETLRLDGPALWQMRTTVTSASVGDTPIDPGSRVAVALASANRDGERWPEPEQFRLDRPAAGAHVAFGHGPHLCLGAALTRLQGVVLLSELARRRITFRVEPGSDPGRAGDLMSTGPAELRVLVRRGAP